jgi:hypothetical protein
MVYEDISEDEKRAVLKDVLAEARETGPLGGQPRYVAQDEAQPFLHVGAYYADLAVRLWIEGDRYFAVRAYRCSEIAYAISEAV